MRISYAVLLMALALPAGAAETFKAYPTAFELVRETSSGDEVLTSGRVLLRVGASVPAETGTRGGEVHRAAAEDHAAGGRDVALRFSLDRAGESDSARLILDTDLEIARAGDRQRREVPDNPDSYIQGPRVSTVSFSHRNWRRQGDPTPIVMPFEEDGERYRLTVLFDVEASE